MWRCLTKEHRLQPRSLENVCAARALPCGDRRCTLRGRHARAERQDAAAGTAEGRRPRERLRLWVTAQTGPHKGPHWAAGLGSAAGAHPATGMEGRNRRHRSVRGGLVRGQGDGRRPDGGEGPGQEEGTPKGAQREVGKMRSEQQGRVGGSVG